MPRRSRSSTTRQKVVLRQDPPGLLLGRPRPDPAQPPGSRHRYAVPFGDLLHRCRAEESGRGLYRTSSTRRGAYPSIRSSPKSQPAKTFYPAEGYHQDYAIAPPRPACTSSSTTLPKVENLHEMFPDVLRESRSRCCVMGRVAAGKHRTVARRHHSCLAFGRSATWQVVVLVRSASFSRAGRRTADLSRL